MICVNLSAVDIIHLQSNNFVTDMKIKTTGESKLNDNPANRIQSCLFVNFERMVKGQNRNTYLQEQEPLF